MEYILKHRKALILALFIVFTTAFVMLFPVQKSYAAKVAYNPPNGEYNLGIGGAPNALNVKGFSTANKANIHIATMYNNAAQRFVVTKVDGKWYKIINKFSGKAVSVKEGKKANGTNIWQYKYGGGKSQQWRFYKVDGLVVMESRVGYVMSVDGNINTDGTNVVLRKYSGSAKQKWLMVRRKGECVNIGGVKTFRLVPKLNSGMSLACAEGLLENKVNVRLGKTNTGTAQKIYATRSKGAFSADMSYLMMFGHSNKMVAVANANTAENANVWQYAGDGTFSHPSQLWKFVPSGDGYYYVRSNLGKYLTIKDGKTAAGTNIQLNSKKKNSDCQKWRVVAGTLGSNTYINRANKFLNDDRWKTGISWGDNQRPKRNLDADWWGCAAYCFDWVYDIYGHKNGPRENATKYTSAGNIKNGDIVHFYRTDGTQHWFAVQSRHGEWIRSAEGNCDGMTRYTNTVYKVKDGYLYEKDAKVKSVEVYHHMSHEALE